MRGWESRGGSYPVCHREALSARAAGGALARGRLRVELCDPVKELAEHRCLSLEPLDRQHQPQPGACSQCSLRLSPVPLNQSPRFHQLLRRSTGTLWFE